MKYSIIKLFKRTVLQARNFWPHILALFFIKLLATPLALMRPLALKILIDCGFGAVAVPGYISFLFPQNFQFDFKTIVFIATALIILIALVENIIAVFAWVFETFTGEKMVLKFRTVVFNHIQRLSLAYHDSKGISDSIYRMQWDTMGVRTFLLDNISPLIQSLITLLSMVIVMFLIQWQLAIIALCVIPPLFILTRLSTKFLNRTWNQVKEDESMAMSVVHEVLSSLRIVKAFGQENKENTRFVKQSDKALKGQLKVAWTGATFNFLVAMVFATGTALFIYFGASYVQSGKMTLGDLTLVISYLGMIFGPLQSISKELNNTQSSITSLNRVYALLDQEKEVKETSHSIHLTRANGSFKFRDVSFSYKEEKPVLQNVSFEINTGDRVGIMGSTGSGKSTLISLLMRFYDTTGGAILIDVNDIRNFKLADYRDQFSIVLQEPVLFSTTIRENIIYGKPDATEKEIIDAAKAANAHDFIIKCIDGYETQVGERGMQLSGGERQRISIARAFIKNAPVLILDEPTSSVDIKTEALIMEAMERLMKGRTTFMITHRLDTLSTCNVILHLQEGRIVDVVKDDHMNYIAKKKLLWLSNEMEN